jgi:tRNA threonylcarbamoyladenosine biosynthesis protein TsaE
VNKEIQASLTELDKVVKYLNDTLPPNAIVFLRGDLAAGKTTLTQAIAKAKGIEGEVTSPTFSLQHCYGEGLYHYDLYRLDHEEFMQLGLFEEFEKEGWHMVEWGSDELKAFLEGVGYNVVTIDIEPTLEGRNYKIVS